MTESILSTTTAGDIVSAALKECGAIGVGQIPLAEDSIDGLARLNWMLAEWNAKRFLIWRLKDVSFVSTGAASYTVGPGGQFDTGVGSQRPDRLEDGNYMRMITQSQPNQIDYPLNLIASREDYNRISLKQLTSFGRFVFYDPGWPSGTLYPWPLPQANIYEIHLLVRETIQTFTTLSGAFALPYNYFNALVTNLALRLKSKYGIPTGPGDVLPGQARAALEAIRGANTAIASLRMPSTLAKTAQYNIFSDQSY